MEAYERYQKKWNEIMESILIMMWLNNISRMEPGKVPVIAGGSNQHIIIDTLIESARLLII